MKNLRRTKTHPGRRRVTATKADAQAEVNAAALHRDLDEFYRSESDRPGDVVRDILRKGKRMMGTEVDDEIHRKAMATRVAHHPFLAGMNSKHLALLTDCAIGAHFNKGQIILRKGEQANRFYLIESGTVNLESDTPHHQPVIIDTIAAGDLLGWSWMFAPYTWQFTAHAAELMSAISFYGTTLREYCERDQSLGYELFKRMTAIMTRRMQAARKRMLGLHVGDISLVAIVRSPLVAHDVNAVPGNAIEEAVNN